MKRIAKKTACFRSWRKRKIGKFTKGCRFLALKKSDLNNVNKTIKLIEELPDGKRERAAKLISKLLFINEQLEKLQEIIAEKGWTETYQNGANQFGIKKSSEGEVYNSLLKNFCTTMRCLNDMLPETEGGGDELEEWLGK